MAVKGFREHISTIFPLLKVESTLVNAANELYSNGLITQDIHTDVTTHLPQPTRQRASSLIAAVNATLATFPEKEQIVLQILDINNTKVFPFRQNTDTYNQTTNSHSQTNNNDCDQDYYEDALQELNNKNKQTTDVVHTTTETQQQQNRTTETQQQQDHTTGTQRQQDHTTTETQQQQDHTTTETQQQQDHTTTQTQQQQDHTTGTQQQQDRTTETQQQQDHTTGTQQQQKHFQEFLSQMSPIDVIIHIWSMFSLFATLYWFQDIDTIKRLIATLYWFQDIDTRSSWFITTMDKQITSYVYFNRFLPLVMISFFVFSIIINSKVDNWRDTALIYSAFQISNFFVFLVWYDNFISKRRLIFGLASMAMLFDISVAVGHPLFQKNNSFLVTAVLKSYKRLQLFVDLVVICNIPQDFYFDIIFLLCVLEVVVRLMDWMTTRLSMKFQISELVIELTMTILVILTRSIIYYSVGHYLSAVLLYTITLLGATTFGTVLLNVQRLMYMITRVNHTLKRAALIIFSFDLLFPLFSFMFELYYYIETHYSIIGFETSINNLILLLNDYAIVSVIVEPVGILILFFGFVSVLYVLCGSIKSTWTIILILTLYGSCVLIFLVAVYKQVYYFEKNTWAYYSMLQLLISRIVLIINVISISEKMFF